MDNHDEDNTAKIEAMTRAIAQAIHVDVGDDDAMCDPTIAMPALLAVTGYVLSYAKEDVPLGTIYQNVLQDIDNARRISIAHSGAVDLFDRLRGRT